MLQATKATLGSNQRFLLIRKSSAVVECFVGSRLRLGGAARVSKDGKINVNPVGGTRKSGIVRRIHVDTVVCRSVIAVLVVVSIVVSVVVSVEGCQKSWFW